MSTRPNNINWDQHWQHIKQGVIAHAQSNYFQGWLEQVEVSYQDPGVISIHCPDLFTRDWIHNHYAVILHEQFAKLSGQPQGYLHVRYLPEGNMSWSSIDHLDSKLKRCYRFNNFKLNAKQQETLITVKNMLNHRLSDIPPFIVTGQQGSGKTHLLQALGNALQYRRYKVVYRSLHDLHHEWQQAIQNNQRQQLQQLYRDKCQCLLIDNIHYLTEVPELQEEIYFMYNSFVEAKKLIGFSSRLDPQQLQPMEQGLKSRLLSILKLNL